MSIVEWAQNSLDFLDKLDKKDSQRIGNYRLFVDFIIKEDKLIIRSIKHRKNAYKELK